MNRQSIPFGIVDRTRGYSVDFARITGPATIHLNPTDAACVRRVTVREKNSHGPGWIEVFDCKRDEHEIPANIDVDFKGTPLMLELEWEGFLPSGRGRIEWQTRV